MAKGKSAIVALLAPVMLWAAPAAKVNPVAEGYPDWQGLTAKTTSPGARSGRPICGTR